MSIQDRTCDDCGSRESWPFIGRGWCFCRKCAGRVAQLLLRYINGWNRDHAPHGRRAPGRRCGTCSMQIETGRYCEECLKVKEARP